MSLAVYLEFIDVCTNEKVIKKYQSILRDLRGMLFGIIDNSISF